MTPVKSRWKYVMQLKAHLGGSFVCILHSFRPSLDGGPNGAVLLKTEGQYRVYGPKFQKKRQKKMKSNSLLDGHHVC